MSRRHERSAEGMDNDIIPHGQGKRLARELSEALRRKGNHMTPNQWNHSGRPREAKKP